MSCRKPANLNIFETICWMENVGKLKLTFTEELMCSKSSENFLLHPDQNFKSFLRWKLPQNLHLSKMLVCVRVYTCVCLCEYIYFVCLFEIRSLCIYCLFKDSVFCYIDVLFVICSSMFYFYSVCLSFMGFIVAACISYKLNFF